MLERAHSFPKMEYLPKRYPNIQQTHAGNCPAHPSRSDGDLQRVHAGLARRVQEKIVVAPVAQAKRTLRYPRQERKHEANLQAENNIENDAQLC